MSEMQKSGARTARSLSSEEAKEFGIIRLIALREAPYLADALFRITPIAVDNPGLRFLAASDQYWRVYLNPKLFNSHNPDLPKEFLAKVLIHEIWHLLRNHCQNNEGYENSVLNNIAKDLEINDDIEWHLDKVNGFHPYLPKGLKLPEHETWQYYYRKLERKQEREQVPAAMCGGGSGATGVAGEWEISAGSQEFPKLEVGVIEVTRTAVAEAIRSEIESGKEPGKFSSAIEAWVNERLEGGQVNWREHLRAAVRASAVTFKGSTDYTMRRPSRRTPPGLYLPSLVTYRPRVAVAFDVSGSMGFGKKSELEKVAIEVEGMLRNSGIREVYAYQVDTQKTSEFVKVTTLQNYQFLRGGGTDMRVAYEALRDIREKIHVMLLCTDGITPWPENPPLDNLKYLALIVTPKPRTAAELVQEHSIPEWIEVIPVALEEI